MKPFVVKIAFAAALCAAVVGTDRTSWAASYGPGTSFDLNYDMSASPYNFPAGSVFTHLSFQISFDPDQDTFIGGETIDLQVLDSSANTLVTFNGFALPPATFNSFSSGFDLAVETTDPIGHLHVTLGPTTTFTNVDFGPLDADLTASFARLDTPLPAALPLFAGGLGVLGLLGWRRKRKA